MDSPKMNGAGQPDMSTLKDRLAWYKHLDQSRHDDLENLAHQLMDTKAALDTARGDLEDERATRRNYRRRAEEAESALVRSQFVLALVDGDGYIFKDAFLKDASQDGGARAAHQLQSEIYNYVRANNIIDRGEFDVVVYVYASKYKLAKYLSDRGMPVAPGELEAFFQSFVRSQPLFYFIDCGPGKERADTKFRDTYKFYAYNSHCRQIFLACCHDNGYVAELDRYRHDSIVAPKTTLVQAATQAWEYNNLPFQKARLNSVFEASAVVPRQRSVQSTPPLHLNGIASQYPSVVHTELSNSQAYASLTSPPATQAALTVRSASTALAPTPVEPINKTTTQNEIQPPKTTGTSNGDTKGITVNRIGQRIDRRMRVPSLQELKEFDGRIQYRKLCNEHHLRDNCYAYNCKYDHDRIDDHLKNTLRYKARSIPCQSGTKCRRYDCYYGHQCPWGNDSCTNPKCAFYKAGLHDINDLEVAKIVAAVVPPPT